MKNSLVSFIVGILFATGLGISGMTNPGKVLAFLNVFGQWDPSLLFVMVGAIAVHFVTYRFIKKQTSPFLDKKFYLPERKDIDKKLVVGATLFGVGWGLAGFCPGPAITSVASGNLNVLVFVLSMLIGMILFKRVMP